MGKCAICSKKLNIFNTGFGNKLKNGEAICTDCLKGFDYDIVSNLNQYSPSELIEIKEVLRRNKEKVKLESQKKKEVEREGKAKEKKMVAEFKRTCNQCGKVWHVLASRENYLEREDTCNSCNQCSSALGTMGGNYVSWGTWTQTKRNEHAIKAEKTKLKQCPDCHSSDYSQMTIEYEK